MARLSRTAGALLLLTACAAPRVEKIAFQDAFPEPAPAPAPAPAPDPAPPKKKKEPASSEVVNSVELQSALVSFSARAWKYRREAAQGSPMPAMEVKNWLQLVEAVDGFLDRSPRQTSSYDVIRARVTLEAELELDGRRYGDIPGDLAEDVDERITRLAVRMSQLRGLRMRARDARPDFEWPVSPVAVTSLFGRRFHPILKVYRQHTGIDLAAELGQPVNAAARGTVIRAEWSGAAGKLVEISHSPTVSTRYGHLSHILVEPGDIVKQGEAVGLAGRTGAATGVHLHFELWRNGRACDPLEELDEAMRSVRPVSERAPVVEAEPPAWLAATHPATAGPR